MTFIHSILIRILQLQKDVLRNCRRTKGMADDVKFSAIRNNITKFLLSNEFATTQDSRMHPFARYVSPQTSVNISADSSPLLLSPDAEKHPNVRNFNLIINNI